MDLTGKVAVITGGASGIGAACCRAFATAGAKVAVVDRKAEGAAAVAAEIGGLGLGCDVSSEAEVDAMVGAVEQGLGPVDVLFNNAGIATGGDPLTTPPAVWDEQWTVNVMAHVYAVRAVWIERKTSDLERWLRGMRRVQAHIEELAGWG